MQLMCITAAYTASMTAQHSTAQHSTAQHSTAQHSTAQHSTAQQYHISKATVTVISQVPPELNKRIGTTAKMAEENEEPNLKSPVRAASSASCLDGAFPHAAVGLSQTW